MNTATTPRSAPRGRAHPHVPQYLDAVGTAERELRDALVLVAERHAGNYELSHGATTLAIWSNRHLEWLEELMPIFGKIPDQQTRQARSGLLGDSGAGVIGELADLCDLAGLVQRTEMLWTVVFQGARELHDDVLVDVSSRARDHTRRQLAWLRTMVEHEAPDAVATGFR